MISIFASTTSSEKLNLFGRFSFADFRHHALGVFGAVAGGPGLSPDGFRRSVLARNQSIAVGANYVLRPDLLTDFRFGFFRYHVNVLPNDLGTTPAKDAGIPGVNLGDILYFRHAVKFLLTDNKATNSFSATSAVARCWKLNTVSMGHQLGEDRGKPYL